MPRVRPRARPPARCRPSSPLAEPDPPGAGRSTEGSAAGPQPGLLPAPAPDGRPRGSPRRSRIPPPGPPLARRPASCGCAPAPGPAPCRRWPPARAAAGPRPCRTGSAAQRSPRGRSRPCSARGWGRLAPPRPACEGGGVAGQPRPACPPRRRSRGCQGGGARRRRGGGRGGAARLRGPGADPGEPSLLSAGPLAGNSSSSSSPKESPTGKEPVELLPSRGCGGSITAGF